MPNELDISYPGSATIYAIIRKESDGKVWNGTTFVTWADGDIATYDVALSSQGGDYYAVDFPAGITTAASYRIFYYVQAGASPATSDLLLDNESLYWTGVTTSTPPSVGNELTTRARVKEYLGIASGTTTYDAQIDTLLIAASRYVEKYCDVESWLTASYTEIHNGTGSDYLSLRNRPITAITRIATSPETVLNVTNTSSSVQRAYISVTSTGLSVVHTISGTPTTTSLLFATYPTLTQLSDAIDAIGYGWNSQLDSTYANYLSSDLRYIQHVSATNGQTAELEMYVDELGFNRIDEDNATIWGDFPIGIQNIEVKYTAGYADVDALPEDLEMGVVALVAGMFNLTSASGSGSSGGGVASEKIGDYSISYFNTTSSSVTASVNTISTDASMYLRAYKRIGAL